MKITCFGQVSFPPEGFVFQAQSSRSRIPVVAVQIIDHAYNLKRLKPLKR